MKNAIGVFFTGSAGLILLIFGMIYLLKGSFMPYHRAAVMIPWNGLQSQYQTLFLALMRATAGGFITLAITMMVLQYRFQKNPESVWIPNLILITGTLFMLCSLYAILLVWINTPGRPPVAADLIGELLLIAGYWGNRCYSKNYRKVMHTSPQ